MKKLLLVFFGILISFNTWANEGMWQPYQLPSLAKELQQMGLEVDPKTMSTLTEFPMNAVISLGGCTASFVSPQGLVVTNHHCAYGSIQFNSKPENNLLENGFLAKTLNNELPAAPGSRVYVTEEVTNVTDKVSSGLSDSLSGKERYQMIEDREKALVSACEKTDGYRCQVYEFHGGLEYYLVKQLEIRDVRLVYAPQLTVGKFGGDIDNWIWPRHTGDFAFYRAYVGPNGEPADFSEDNKPYVPSSFLKVSAKGIERGDFVMVAGYPGRTYRYRTVAEVNHQFGWAYPTAKALREEFIDIIKTVAPEGSDARIKYESTIAGLANYAKNYQGMLDGFARSSMLEDKIRIEQELITWIKADKQREQKYKSALDDLAVLINKRHENSARELFVAYVERTTMLPTAKRLYRLAHEKTKADSAREPGYQERDMKAFASGMKRISRRFHPDVDRAALAHFIKRYAALPKEQRVPEFDKFFAIKDTGDNAGLDALLENMYAKTQLNDEATRLSWMDQPIEKFKTSDDPFIKFAVVLFDTHMKQEAERKELNGLLQKARSTYMEAIIAYNNSIGKPVYADANSSLRVTYGTVKGYSPKDGAFYTPFTSLQGIEEKYKKEWPFNAPKKQMELIEAKTYGDYELDDISSVPVNYLSTVDITGGNSGSPTLNGKAELVGLAFDGVYESINGDWEFDPKLNRAIHVDSRYMLWVMKYLDEADNLINEMTIVE